MPVQPDDYAIVIGIGRYPGFGSNETEANDLNGPDDDAKAIYDWLVAPDKGGVLPANAKLIRSADFPPAPQALKARPHREAIVEAFDELESAAQQNDQQGNGLRVGRRLYLYASGHGFAQRRKEGCVFVANATRVRTHHVFASGWLEWFYNAQYFDELVLWMDCCMVSDLAIVPEVAGYRKMHGTTPTSKLFSAFAAKFPQQAVERPMPDGKVHGVFTYTLLEGLKGVAADPVTDEVTSATLRDHLTNTMKTYLSEADLNDDIVAKEPDFGFDDPMVFCTVPGPQSSTVTLTGFPAGAAGKPFVVLTGAPPQQAAAGSVQNGTAQVQLRPGIGYVLTMSNPPLVKGFEVLGGENVGIDLAQ
jgi:uncharacterized caspase-like protein